MNKERMYKVLQNIHMIRNELCDVFDKDFNLYCTTYKCAPTESVKVYLTNAFRLYRNLNVYEVDMYAHSMVQNTMVNSLPTNRPDLLNKTFMLTCPNIVSTYDMVVYAVVGKEYECQLLSNNDKIANITIQGNLDGIHKKTNFNIKNITNNNDLIPPESPEEIKNKLFNYLYTFAILLECEKTPIEVIAEVKKIKNAYAKKANVPKRLWTTNKIFLNATMRRIYETERMSLSKDGKLQVPTITKCHIRNIIDKNGREKQVFVSSYVSMKYKNDKLRKMKVSTLNV